MQKYRVLSVCSQELDFSKPLPEESTDLMRRQMRHVFNSKEVIKGADFRVSSGAALLGFVDGGCREHAVTGPCARTLWLVPVRTLWLVPVSTM